MTRPVADPIQSNHKPGPRGKIRRETLRQMLLEMELEDSSLAWAPPKVLGMALK